MKVFKNDQVYYVRWQYFCPKLDEMVNEAGISVQEAKDMSRKELRDRLGVGHLPPPSHTQCIIEDANTGQTLSAQTVVRYYNKPHSFETARSRSLTKALKAIFPERAEKDERKAFWDVYLGRARKVAKTVKVWINREHTPNEATKLTVAL